MNLLQASYFKVQTDIHAGGPGSGCQGGNCGHKSKTTAQIRKAFIDYQRSFVKSGGVAKHGSFEAYMKTYSPQDAKIMLDYDKQK